MIFAKSYRGELMLSVIWYAPHACFYATLSPASSDEQTLVDTAFPQVRLLNAVPSFLFDAMKITHLPPVTRPLDLRKTTRTYAEGVRRADDALFRRTG